MPFIQTGLAHSESANPKTTTRYVYNMSLFLVPRLLNRWQRASCARCLQTKAPCFTTPRSSKPLGFVCVDLIEADIEDRQHRALRKNSCEQPCPSIPDTIAPDIEVSQSCALRQHPCKTPCPSWSDLISEEMQA
jgi:hypothetical protein